jgi:membrane-associated phospholipid phosphatase
MHFVTDFADQAVILPAAAVTLLVLLAAGWWRGALAWVVVVPATLGVVLVAKMTTMACQDLVPPVGLFSPSGHTASAALVYGGLLALLLGEAARSRLVTALACAGAVAMVVGYTRLSLGVHTVADVVAGGAIGMAGVGTLALAAGARPPRRRAWMGLAAAVVCAAVLFHGRHVYAEMHIRQASNQIWPLSLCTTTD